MSIRKVCPSCKKCDEVTEISYPATRISKMSLSPKRKDGKLILDSFYTDVEDEWCDYDMDARDPSYICSCCDYEYYSGTWNDVWEEMVWRKNDI